MPSTQPDNKGVLGYADLGRSHFGANFCPKQVVHTIMTVPNLRTVAATANLENWDGADNAQIGSSQTSGYTLASGSDVNLLWPLPNDMDVNGDVEFNVLASNSEAVDAAKLWTLVTLVKAMIVGTTAVAIAATAVTSEMATIKNVGASVLQRSATWAKISGATFAALGLTAGTDALSIMITGTATGSADLTIHAIQARFYVQQISGGSA